MPVYNISLYIVAIRQYIVNKRVSDTNILYYGGALLCISYKYSAEAYLMRNHVM